MMELRYEVYSPANNMDKAEMVCSGEFDFDSDTMNMAQEIGEKSHEIIKITRLRHEIDIYVGDIAMVKVWLDGEPYFDGVFLEIGRKVIYYFR
jgi:hypothetical protein